MISTNPLFIDIKTVGLYPDYQVFLENDSVGAELFYKKYINIKDANDYKSIHEFYIHKSQLYPQYGKIIFITCGVLRNNKIVTKNIVNSDEKQLLVDFLNILYKIESTDYCLVGFMIKSFDIPWIIHKCIKYGCKIPGIINTINKRWYEMKIIDIHDIWKNGYSQTFSFKEMCYELNINDEYLSFLNYNIHEKYWGGELDKIISDNEKYIKMLSYCYNKIIKCYNY